MTPPLFALDMRTLAVLMVGLGAIVAAVFLGLWRQGAGGRPALLWALAHGLGATAYLLIALRDLIPEALSIVVANVALHAAAYLLLRGTCALLQRPSPDRMAAAVLAAEALALAYWTYADPNLTARILVASGVGGGFLIATGLAFLRSRDAGARRPYGLTGAAFTVTGAFLVLRGVITLALPPQEEDFMAAGLLQAGSMALLLLAGMVWSLLLLWLMAYAWFREQLEEAQAREQTEAALRESEERFRTIFEGSANAVAFGDENGRIILANQAFHNLLGYGFGELEGAGFGDITHPEDLPREQEQLRRLLADGHDHYRLEKRYLAKDGEPVWVDLIVSAVRRADGTPRYFIGVASDIQEKRAAQAELEYRATYDSLTGAVNRLAFEQYLEAELNRVGRYDEPAALVMFDIDHFKRINDTYGHGAGDQVLITLVERARHRLRAADILGRWGGEEFMVLLPETDGAGAEQVAQDLRAAVAEEAFPGVGRVTISLGVAQLRGEETFTTLQMRVDEALYAAKKNGRNRVARAGEPGEAPRLLSPD